MVYALALLPTTPTYSQRTTSPLRGAFPNYEELR
jgi:hypothetical protein